MRPHLRDFKAEAEALGLTDVAFERGGKHWHVTGLLAGKTFKGVLPGTPSDRRGDKNSISELRRWVFETTGTKPWLQ